MIPLVAGVVALCAVACGGEPKPDPACGAPIAGVCTSSVPAKNTDRAVGGGPVETTTVTAPVGPDAGVTMPQFVYGSDGSVRVGP